MKFTMVDLNEQRVAAWSSDDLPIYEPAFDEVVGAATGTCSFPHTLGEPSRKQASSLLGEHTREDQGRDAGRPADQVMVVRNTFASGQQRVAYVKDIIGCRQRR